MADAVVTMQARWDGAALRRGMQQARTDLDELKKKTGEVTSFMAGPLGFLGVSVGVATFTQKLRELGEEDRQMRRLVSTVQRFAGTTPDMRELNKVLVDLRRNSMFGDTELAGTLAQLTTQVGDYAKALKLLPVVVDTAASSQKSLAESAKIVANVQAGIIEPLGEMLPHVKAWTRANSDLIGTSKAAAYGMNELLKAVSSGGKAETDSLAGSFKLAAEGVNELTDSLLELNSSTINDWARGVGTVTDWLAERVRDLNREYGALARILTASPFNPLAIISTIRGVTSGGAQPGTPMGGRPVYPLVPIDKPTAPVDPEWAESRRLTDAARARDRMFDHLRGLTPTRELRSGRPEYLEDLKKTIDYLKEIRGIVTEIPLSDEMQILASTLQDYMYGAFQSIRQGWQGLVSYMKELLFRELFTNLAALGINAIFQGSPGVFTPLGKAIGLGKNTSAGSFGASAAAMQQAQWRAMRRVYG